MNTNFQHTESQMHRAFNVSDEQRNYIMHNIIFETINTYIQVYRLYDDWDDAPHEMTANTDFSLLDVDLSAMNCERFDGVPALPVVGPRF